MAASLMNLSEFELWAEGLDHPECVASAADGSVYAGGEAGQIYQIDETGNVEQIASTDGFVLGLCLDGDHNIYACDIKHNSIFRVTREGIVGVYSTGTTDHRLVNPNYPVFDARGNLYVSASGHWNQQDGCIYRIAPGGKTELWTRGPAQFPNGLALSSDGKKLFVALSTMPGVVCVDINADGSAGRISEVATLPHTVPDGLALDIDQNLYVSCYTPDIIYMLRPSGELAVLVEDWQHVTISSPTNLAFCGKARRSLVVASLGRWHLTRAEMHVAGQKLHYPRL